MQLWAHWALRNRQEHQLAHIQLTHTEAIALQAMNPRRAQVLQQVNTQRVLQQQRQALLRRLDAT
jgi:Tfp pilus assembly protein FimT